MVKITTLEELKKATEGTKFAQDMTNQTNINGKPMPFVMWNLAISIRDCELYSKGIKIHRNWKISDVKRYFGISGSAEKMAETLENYRDILMPKEEKDYDDKQPKTDEIIK